MLEVTNLSGGYGRAPTLENIALKVARGETVAVLGPNGAGKSTFLAALSGVLPQRSGSVRLDGEEIGGLASHAIVARGLVQVPEGRRMFAPMTVADNLRLGAVRLAGRGARLATNFDAVYGLFPRLAERRAQLAGTLSGGEQQMVAIGRALMSSPRVLLLDEPFLGLAPKIVEEIRAALNQLRAGGLTMLLVEQKLDIALSFASRACVLIKGRVALQAASAELAAREDLARLYFDLAHSGT
ncbi:MAG: ABC transporter ATP-binding protein [Burkholderiales bacterium]|nr:ABC transporter ATP-binding protein [Burkholderiales bacterium]